MTLNPFILRMFKHISFKSWLKIYRSNIEKRSDQRLLKGEIDVSDAEIEAAPLQINSHMINDDNE